MKIKYVLILMLYHFSVFSQDIGFDNQPFCGDLIEIIQKVKLTEIKIDCIVYQLDTLLRESTVQQFVFDYQHKVTGEKVREVNVDCFKVYWTMIDYYRLEWEYGAYAIIRSNMFDLPKCSIKTKYP